MSLTTRETEAANRAEATALLIRAGYRVYRPEADVAGEDLVLQAPNGSFLRVQLKANPHVDASRYAGLMMLFPDWHDPFARHWWLVPHDVLFDYARRKHGQAGGWDDTSWNWPYAGQELSDFLRPWRNDSWPLPDHR